MEERISGRGEAENHKIRGREKRFRKEEKTAEMKKRGPNLRAEGVSVPVVSSLRTAIPQEHFMKPRRYGLVKRGSVHEVPDRL